MYRPHSSILVVSITALLAAPAAADWEQEQFVMLLGWPVEIACPDEEALARAMKEAGFNVIMWDVQKLDLCQRWGLQVCLFHGESGLTPKLVAQVKNHPAPWGYYIKDEPTPELFPRMAQEHAAITAADPTRPTYINLLARGGEYLSRFMEEVKPDYLSYDYYQWWSGREKHFLFLEQHRRAALAASVPLFCWVEVGAADTDNLVKVRQSVYTNLAYGVTGIQWFTGAQVFKHGTAQIEQRGQDVAVINRELAQLGPELVKLRSTEVFHTGELPAGTRALPEDWWVTTGTPDLVLGFFVRRDGEPGDYMMVTNRHSEEARSATLQLRRPVTGVERLDRPTGRWEPVAMGSGEDRPSIELMLPAGDGVLLRVR